MARRDPLASLRRLGRVQLNAAKTDAAEAARVQRSVAEAAEAEAASQRSEQALLVRSGESEELLPYREIWLRRAGAVMQEVSARLADADLAVQAARDQLAQRWGRLESIDGLMRTRRAAEPTARQREDAAVTESLSTSGPQRSARGPRTGQGTG